MRARAAHHRSMQIDGGERSEKLKIRERESVIVLAVPPHLRLPDALCEITAEK